MSYSRFLMSALVCAGLVACSPMVSNAALPTTLANPGFDAVNGSLPAGWVLDKAVSDKGKLRVLDTYPDAVGKVMELQPNNRNSGDKLLGVGQMLDANPLRGRTLTVTTVTAASGGASAIVGVHALGKSGDMGFVQLSQGDSGGVLRTQQKTLDIPAGAQNLIVYAIVTGGSGKAVFDTVSVSLDAAPAAAPKAAPTAGTKASAQILIDTGRSIRQIPAGVFGTNVEWIFDGQGLWSAKRNALDAEAIKLTRELSPSLIRFPGGVFSDFYNWRDGTGPRDKRPTTEHHPKGPKSRHNFGLPELAEFSKAVGAELLLTVNAGTGTPKDAAEWVQYMNQSGGPKVRYWEIGNELYMKDDLSGAHMSPDDYARRFESFAAAMRGVDPSIRLGGIGGLNYGNYRFIADDRWTETLLKRNAAQMDFLAIHNAYAPVVMGPSASADPKAVYTAMLAAPVQIERNLQDVSKLLARYEKPGRPIAIAITEWGPFFHVLPSSPWVDHIKTMGSAMFVASTMNSFLRTPRVEIANFFKLADHGFMGWIGRRNGEASVTAPYMAFAMYRHSLGRNLVDVKTTAPTFKSRELGVVNAIDAVPLLDAVATFDGDSLTLLVVNKSETQDIETSLALKGVAGYGGATVKTIHAASFDAHTGTELPKIPGLNWARQTNLARFDKGGPGEIGSSSETLPAANAAAGAELQLSYSFRPMSITSVSFSKVKRQGK